MRTSQKSLTPRWCETLAGGLAGGVITTDELVCGLKSPFPHLLGTFLARFLGEPVQLSELRTAIRALSPRTPRRKRGEAEWQTFEDVHELARRTDAEGFYRKSVALNYVRRGVKFSWESDPVGGLEIFLKYLSSLDDFLESADCPRPSDYATFRILSDFFAIGDNLNRRFGHLIRIADFEKTEHLRGVLAESRITAMQATVFGLSNEIFAKSICLGAEFRKLARAIESQHELIAAAQLIREIPNAVPDAPYREWLQVLGSQGRATLDQPKTGGWWYVQSAKPRPA